MRATPPELAYNKNFDSELHVVMFIYFLLLWEKKGEGHHIMVSFHCMHWQCKAHAEGEACMLAQIEAEVMRVMAEEGRVDLLAKWMGILIRGGHER